MGESDGPHAEGRPSRPTMADRYQALARVGVGGTAVVFRCRDLHTQRIVAVKVLKAAGSINAPEAAARFRREARLAAHLAHPNIVRVLDYGLTLPVAMGVRGGGEDPDRPVPYLAMEYIFGFTLKDLIRRVEQTPIDWVWQIGEQLCAALAAAHSIGVVHRDMKPQNVMLLDSPLELLVKLTDFGIARQIGGDLTALTATGQIIGTPDYLSPEQVLGEPGGPSSDLYSLGIVLYELVTGRLPFEADTPLAAASKRMIVDPPPLTAFRRDTPPALQEVILTALRRDMADRFQSSAEFAQALRWSRAESPGVSAPPRGSWLPKNTPPGERTDQATPALVQAAGRSATPIAQEFDLSQQSTILRVMTDLTQGASLPDLDPPADEALPPPLGE